jgi:hypothetical protein
MSGGASVREVWTVEVKADEGEGSVYARGAGVGAPGEAITVGITDAEGTGSLTVSVEDWRDFVAKVDARLTMRGDLKR